MSNPRRAKRASPEDLYKSCALGGDCKPDVQNKIEGKTLADRLLQIFGSFLYFGGLGIGTGKGTGGITGYRPIGAGSNTTTSIPLQPRLLPKPTIPIDPLGGTDILPLDVIDASAPSVVPLNEGVPETTIISSGTGPTVTVGDFDVTTTIDLPGATGGIEHPAVINVTDEGTSVVDLQTRPPAAKKFILDSSISNEIELQTLSTNAHFSDSNVYVDTHFSGEVIGGNIDMPIQTQNPIEQFEIADVSPRTSTPAEQVGRAMGRAKDLYHRFVKQVPAQSLQTVVQPSRQVTFEFENPAFDDEVSLVFNQELEEVTGTPNPDFRDIQYISRPRLSETESGRVIYSRLGQRATMQTRSGLVIGEKVHFYYNISDIPRLEEIELSTLGHTSNDATFIDAQLESSLVDVENPTHISYPDESLLDNNIEDFSNAHLILTTTDDLGDTYDIPTLPPGLGLKIFVPDVGEGLFYSYPVHGSVIPPYLPDIPYTPLEPTSVNIYGDTFTLHPSLLRRKRKRKYNQIYY